MRSDENRLHNEWILDAIAEFREIYRNNFKEELSEQDAYRLANGVLNLYRVIYESDYPIKQDST